MKAVEFVLSTSRRLTNLFFNLWLFVDGKARVHQTCKNLVYDSLGIIDTLGSSSSSTKFTYKFSEELGCLYGFYLPFGYKIEYRNYFDHELVLYK